MVQAIHADFPDEYFIKDWLDRGNDPDELDKHCQTPLFHASLSPAYSVHHISIIKLLVSRGADVNQDFDYPLHCAVACANARTRDGCAVVECLEGCLLSAGDALRGLGWHHVVGIKFPPGWELRPSSLEQEQGVA